MKKARWSRDITHIGSRGRYLHQSPHRGGKIVIEEVTGNTLQEINAMVKWGMVQWEVNLLVTLPQGRQLSILHVNFASPTSVQRLFKVNDSHA